MTGVGFILSRQLLMHSKCKGTAKRPVHHITHSSLPLRRIQNVLPHASVTAIPRRVYKGPKFPQLFATIHLFPMSSVIVSHVPKSVSLAKLKEFFAFCGVIKLVDELGADSNGYLKYQVNFELEKALSTALLLNDAELDSVPIAVHEETPPSYASIPDKREVDDNKIQSQDAADNATITGDKEYDDILQEEKPKLAILAQLLALGYLVSDDLIRRAVKFDNEKGYTSKFKSFLTDLDQKYVGSQEPGTTANKGLNKAQSKFASLQQSFQGLSYQQKLQHYFDKASNHPFGIKVHDFYKLLSKEVQDVHAEAKRLYELKRADRTEANPETTEAASTEAVATGAATEPVASESTNAAAEPVASESTTTAEPIATETANPEVAAPDAAVTKKS